MNQNLPGESVISVMGLIDEILSLDKRIDSTKQTLNLLEETRAGVALALQSAMANTGATELSSRLGSASLKSKTVYSVEPGGWPKLYERIVRTGEFDLLTKRLSSTAMRERAQANDLPDGVRATDLPVLTVKGR